MHTLTSTLLAAQKAKQSTPYFRMTFSLTGETNVVIEQDRILSSSGIESADSQKATFVFQNSTGYFTSLDLKGWQVVIERGLKNAVGTVEYDSMPPMKVMSQNLSSSDSPSLTCTMSFEGIPDQLKRQKASKKYFNHWSNTKTVKDLFTEIADGDAVDTALTEEQTTTDDFVTMPITIGTTDTAGAVKTTAAVDTKTLAINNLGTGQITKGTTLTIAGDSTIYTVANTVAISGNEATVTLTDGLAAQATAGAVVTLAAEAGTRLAAGIALTVSNRTIATVTFKLKKVGTPAGNVTFKVSQDDGGSVLASKTVATSAISTSAALVTATLDTPLLVDERVWFTCEYSGGDASNYICVAINSALVKFNEAFVSDAIPDAAASPDVSWEDANQSCVYQYTYTGGTGETNGVDCFQHCHDAGQAYEVVYDSEDSLIDSYAPADGFQIVEDESRFDALNRVIGFSGCVWRVQADGKLHVMIPPSLESLTTGDTAGLTFYGASRWLAQSFTPTYTHTFKTLKVKIGRTGSGGLPSTLTFGLYAVDGSGYPTGAVLCSGTYDGDTLTTATACDWYTVSFGSGASVTANTKYAIVIKALSGDANNTARWRYGAALYSSGAGLITLNAGSAWSDTGIDFLFEDVSYDYEYQLGAGNHEFFAKSVRNSLVSPNKITVHSYDDNGDLEYSGSATDATSYAIIPIEAFVRAKCTSTAQANSVAAALIAQVQMNAQQGSATVPMNLGAEIYDYVKVTDSRQSDSRTGNIGYIKWWFIPGKGYKMAFSFGRHVSRAIGGPPSTPKYRTGIQSFADVQNFVDEQLAVSDTYDDDLTEADKQLTYLLGKDQQDTRKGPITIASIISQIATSIAGFIKNLVEDTTPQLGGDLDANGHKVGGFGSSNNFIANTSSPAGNMGVYAANTADDDFALFMHIVHGDAPYLNMNDHPITSLPTPTTGQDTYATPKSYVDKWSVGLTTVASANIKNSNDLEKATAGQTYVKLKETKSNQSLTGVRVYCDLKGYLGNVAYYTLYKNGVALGTEHSTVSTTGETFYDDVTGIVPTDLLQAWAKGSGPSGAAVFNFRLAFDVLASVTNQDP